MRCTPEHALALLEQWRTYGTWILVIAHFDGGDEHRLWARIRSAGPNEIWLAGESAMVSLRIDSKGCQYSELPGPPPEVPTHHRNFGPCLNIQCSEFSAVLASLKVGEEP